MKLQEVSMCSTILHPNDETNATKEVNETKATDMTTTGMPQSENCRKTSENILFDTERVKKAGHFLEECRLFLSGFLESDIDKFRLAIQMAGGVCLGQLTSSITHFVAKKPVDDHYKLMEELQLKPYKVCKFLITSFILTGTRQAPDRPDRRPDILKKHVLFSKCSRSLRNG